MQWVVTGIGEFYCTKCNKKFKRTGRRKMCDECRLAIRREAALSLFEAGKRKRKIRL